ncbi:hypothetical protein [Streptomyces monashensis]|uniref:Uncharacterized protein n=1 Tax=Streptomyces monashensis TaxID=1678012 RepID=A0A1S2PU02_9ACTN|nr:hypothetical protein [Streptomyces monashensis]OIJ96404.1 hypothetical protein BIV23_32760 [Streptomyces monashensis]
MRSEPIHEAYSFVCLRCGHAWEGAYDIRHVRDAAGRLRAAYYVRGGLRVPSPLTANTCRVCGGHRVRILRPGRVDAARTGAAAPRPR